MENLKYTALYDVTGTDLLDVVSYLNSCDIWRRHKVILEPISEGGIQFIPIDSEYEEYYKSFRLCLGYFPNKDQYPFITNNIIYLWLKDKRREEVPDIPIIKAESSFTPNLKVLGNAPAFTEEELKSITHALFICMIYKDC